MADQTLQLRLTQKLALSPQLQQAIRLLQLNRIELREYIQDALDANPLLERSETGDDIADDPGESKQDGALTSQEKELHDQEFPDDEDWESGPSPEDQWVEGSGREPFDGEPQIAGHTDQALREHLLWQVNLSYFSEVDAAIATAIVYGLDDDGWLQDSIEDIRAGLAPELLVEEAEVLAVLHRIQRMEPVGVASRNPAECIRVQLSVMPADVPGRELALRIARDFLDLVARHDLDGLRRHTGAQQDKLLEALRLIQTLEPHPGARYDNRRNEYVVPDVYVTRAGDAWRVTLNPENDPGLRLNKYYIDLLRKSGGKDAEYLKGRLQEARWLMSSLEMRNRTLLNVAQSIVSQQEDFLLRGEIAMRPLVLRNVADQIGVHESTVSRATTRKYLLTPRGIYELKYFFSSHVPTERGGAVSATAVKARLQVLLESESASGPLSDQELANLLLQVGVRAARRTVAKYRESLGIGSSAERRREYRRQQALRKSGLLQRAAD
ncbi:MAG TPA: RNA polymerase factor sigma-54 [Xanthomonadales bacterium]|nr:RNA polymerase factor sigma-54 [Xanthomonadales bacterium]